MHVLSMCKVLGVVPSKNNKKKKLRFREGSREGFLGLSTPQSLAAHLSSTVGKPCILLHLQPQ